MNKAELLKRQQMLSAVPTDQADDFEDIILAPSAPGVDKEKVVHLPISKTVEYSDEDFERATGRPQPFKVYTEDRMESLCKSIADIGVIDPITVRPLPDGTYQVLAGRHRRRASIRIGAETIPAIIRSDISDYGSYIDPSLYGMNGDPYYTANAREAIAKTDFGGSVEAVAARLARMARNSSSHWSYVGSAGYTYIGVGITYKNGVWYCDIAVTETNTDAQ